MTNSSNLFAFHPWYTDGQGIYGIDPYGSHGGALASTPSLAPHSAPDVQAPADEAQPVTPVTVAAPLQNPNSAISTADVLKSQRVAAEKEREARQEQFLRSAPKPDAASSAAVRAMNALSGSMSIPTAHIEPFSFQRVGG